MKFQPFDDDAIYSPREAAAATPFAERSFAKWRCLGGGPAYLKINGRIFYRGSALNAWLAGAERGGAPEPEAA